MKNILTVLVCIAFFSFSSDCFSTETMPQNNLLTEILVSKEKPLKIENLTPGFITHAHKVTTFDSNGTQFHMGYYLCADIITFVNNYDDNRVGKQTITYHKPGKPSEQSHSTIWEVKTIKGEKYIVYYHNGLRVYSNRNKQYVIVD